MLGTVPEAHTHTRGGGGGAGTYRKCRAHTGSIGTPGSAGDAQEALSTHRKCAGSVPEAGSQGGGTDRKRGARTGSARHCTEAHAHRGRHLQEVQGTHRKRSGDSLTKGRFGISYPLPQLFSGQHSPADSGSAAHRVPRALSSCRLGPCARGRPPPAAAMPGSLGSAYKWSHAGSARVKAHSLGPGPAACARRNGKGDLVCTYSGLSSTWTEEGRPATGEQRHGSPSLSPVPGLTHLRDLPSSARTLLRAPPSSPVFPEAPPLTPGEIRHMSEVAPFWQAPGGCHCAWSWTLLWAARPWIPPLTARPLHSSQSILL